MIDIYRMLNILIEEKNIARIEQVIREQRIDVNDYRNVSQTILILRYYLLLDNIPLACNYLERLFEHRQLKKRHLFLIIDDLVQKNMIQKAVEICQFYLKENIIFDRKDIRRFLTYDNSPLRQLLFKHLIRQPLILNQIPNHLAKDIIIETQPHALSKFELSDQEKQLLISHIINDTSSDNKLYDSFLSFCQSNNYNIVIDGGNVLYSYKGRKNQVGYWRLNTIISYLKKNGFQPLVILHQKHKFQTDCLIYRSPYGLNDDIFLLLAALTHQSTYILSNDCFRDHIFKYSIVIGSLNLLQQFELDYRLSYSFSQKNFILSPIRSFSYLIQHTNTAFQIPTASGWLHVPFTQLDNKRQPTPLLEQKP